MRTIYRHTLIALGFASLIPLAQAASEPADTDVGATSDTTSTQIDEHDRSLDQAAKKQDASLSRKVKQAINDDKALSSHARAIKVTSSGGRITLKGTVDSADEQARVEECAKTVKGVLSVKNQTNIFNAH